MTLLDKEAYSGYMGNQAWQIIGPWGGSGPTMRLKDICTRLGIEKGTPMVYSVRVKFDEELLNARNAVSIAPTLFRVCTLPDGSSFNPKGNEIKIADIEVGKWYTFYVPFTIPVDATEILNTTRWECNYFDGQTGDYSIDSVFHGSSPKLEIGNIATDWTQAPEDIEVEMEDLVVSTETQYCLGSSTTEHPAEDNAGWGAVSKVGNSITEEYLWVRTKNTTKSDNVFYSNYYCLVQAQKVLKSQTTEYLLSASANSLSDAEKAEGAKETLWTINKPTDPVEGKDYLWTRTHAVYNYVGAGLDGQTINEYYDYTLDTSWHVLFNLTDSLKEQIATILTDLTGGYVHIQDGGILVGNDKNNPSKLIVINHKGIAFFDNEEDGWPDSNIYDSQTSAWSIDGTLNMDEIEVNGLKASSIENENLVLGKGTAESAALSGDLDIYDKYGNLMFETIVNEDNADASKNDFLIYGFKIYKYKENADKTLTQNGHIFLSRNGFKEYDAGGNVIFGNNGLEQFASKVNRTNQQIITNKTPDSTATTEYGIQMIPMQVTNAGDGLTHTGVAFLKL